LSGANQRQAGRQAAALLRHSMPGKTRSVQRHTRRADQIGDLIWRRWQVIPEQWQVKHLRWYLSHETRDLAPASRYDHWRTVRALVAALGRLDDWLPHLRGPWLRPTGDASKPNRHLGGRPARLPAGRPIKPSKSNTNESKQHGKT